MNLKSLNSIIAIVVVGVVLLGCQSDKFKVSDDGYEYKYITKGSGELPLQGEVIVYNMKYVNEKDSLIFESTPEQPALVRCDTIQWDSQGPLYKAFKMIKEGDSILIKIPTKTLFDESFRAAVPPSLDPEGSITFCIGASDIMNQEEMMAKALEENQKMRTQYLMANQEIINADLEVIDAFLSENNITAQSAESGIRYVVDVEGAGSYPQAGDNVAVHYTGTLLDGTEFDSSVGKGPYQFQLGMGSVIIGWDLGVPLFKEGGKGTIYIPSTMAYGERGSGAVIAPNSVLKFDVEVVKIN